MHFGNLSFFAPFSSALMLAPIYDMLPMMYAPVAGDELPNREFEAPLPTAGNLNIWKSIAEAAERYWREVASHDLMSTEFAERASRHAEVILRARDSVP
jgi:hypothetical protein